MQHLRMSKGLCPSFAGFPPGKFSYGGVSAGMNDPRSLLPKGDRRQAELILATLMGLGLGQLLDVVPLDFLALFTPQSF